MGDNDTLRRIQCKADILITIKKDGPSISDDEANLAAVLVEQQFNANQKIVSEDEGLTAYPRVHIKSVNTSKIGTEET